MELYSGNKDYKLYHGNCLDIGEVVADNSIDSIVTDPPYELDFMSKSWDRSGIAFRKETWEKFYNVLKPGGYLLAFGGSRTFHRIACAIEDAGFEIRDTIMWLYGCYSADTQVLTDKGWKYFYDLDKTERILQWDKDTNKLSWIKPPNYFEYDIDDELRLFENRHISQLVTKNHKVAVSVKKRRKEYGNWELIEADTIQKSWNLKFPCAGELQGSVHEEDAYIIGWWLTDAYRHKDGKACMFSQSKCTTLNKLRNWFDTHNVKYSEYVKQCKNEKHNDEHIFYVTGSLADKLLTQYPNRELSWDMLNWDVESRALLLEGLMDGDGSYHDNSYSRTFWSKKAERCDIIQSICLSLNYRTYLCYKNGEINGVNFNIAHNCTEMQTKHRKADVKYRGKVYCLQTETGAFVVRRNGKSFISGNSGFPKSMDIGKAVESKILTGSANTQEWKNLEGTKVKSGDWGVNENCFRYGARPSDYSADGHMRTEKVDYKTEEGKRWDGWGTALKPSYEPVIVARKPCEGTCVDNVLKYGVGGMNIDGCRVGNTERTEVTVSGRFPSNTILTYDDSDYDEVCGGMPVGGKNGSITKDYRDCRGDIVYGRYSDTVRHWDAYADSGSASRYFYCAKASVTDREEGLESLKDGIFRRVRADKNDDNPTGLNKEGRFAPVSRKNIHPTVKPTSLMQYLVRLVTPKGGVILDPFNGSGSTGKAVMTENRERNAGYQYIGIELTDEYLPIAKGRIEYILGVETLPNEIHEPDMTAVPKTTQLSLWDCI